MFNSRKHYLQKKTLYRGEGRGGNKKLHSSVERAATERDPGSISSSSSSSNSNNNNNNSRVEG